MLTVRKTTMGKYYGFDLGYDPGYSFHPKSTPKPAIDLTVQREEPATPPIKSVTLTLSKEQAVALRALAWRASGDNFADELWLALANAKVGV